MSLYTYSKTTQLTNVNELKKCLMSRIINLFLAWISPNLDPIELWFSFLKQKLSEMSNWEKVTLISIESQNKLQLLWES